MEIIKGTITVVLIIISLIGILLVLMQSSRGSGGLFGDAGGSSSVIGSDRKGDFFSRLTGIFLAIFLGGSLLLAYLDHIENAGIAAPPSDFIEEADTKATESTESTSPAVPDIKIETKSTKKTATESKTDSTIKSKAKIKSKQGNK